MRFIRYGELGDVYMPRDLRSGEPRGFAFVRYMSQRDADDAIDRLDGEFFAGRELRIQASLSLAVVDHASAADVCFRIFILLIRVLSV